MTCPSQLLVPPSATESPLTNNEFNHLNAFVHLSPPIGPKEKLKQKPWITSRQNTENEHQLGHILDMSQEITGLGYLHCKMKNFKRNFTAIT